MTVDATQAGLPTPGITEEEFALFRALIYEQTGIHLRDSKRSLVASRLSRRLRNLKLDSLGKYYRYLKTSDPRGEELRKMINCITTNKTSFFREIEHFRFLTEWLRSRASESRHPRRFRAWSAACSTGEEPYSIAMTAMDALGPQSGWDIQILASDIDTDVLATAGKGVYDMEGLHDLDMSLLRRYFLRGKGEWDGFAQVKPHLRRAVEFRQVNLVADTWPVQGSFDVIFCRNVIIYFDRETQQRLFERLVPHLEPDGLLFVGHSESLFWLTQLVKPIGHTIYRRFQPSDKTIPAEEETPEEFGRLSLRGSRR